tara:strand:- start:152 stop:295 length:144 start_codon:yes stop_codon:yes gene_type:complete
MKVEVQLYCAGKIIKEIVYVERFEDAEKVALQRNPTLRVISRNVIFT